MEQSKENIAFIQEQLEQNHAFALWHAPLADNVEKLSCPPEALIRSYTAKGLDARKGFVFAPFQSCRHLPIYLIPFHASQAETGEAAPLEASHNNRFSKDIKQAQKQHKQQIEQFFTAFKQDHIRKAVLSRNQWVNDYNREHMPALFHKLCEYYPRAFTYLVHIPEAGYWVGATPELLFKNEANTGTTVSLAGTQRYRDDLHWGKKEQVEQELVTEHIRSVLQNFDVKHFEELGPDTIKTGDIAHLKTIINLDTTPIKQRMGEFIDQLHPTPAICGLPVQASKELILATENYDRSYYCGYLGPFNPEQDSSLFVNLRCLQAFDDGLVLYAGGGITPDSDADMEWEETCMKMQNLTTILAQLEK